MPQISLPQLAIRVLLDSPPLKPTDGAYLYAQTEDNADSVLKRGLDLLKCGATRSLLISGCPARSGYPGYASWHKEIKNDAPEAQIFAIPPPAGEILHTGNESQELIAYALSKNLRALHIVAAPLHQLRAFISAVSALRSLGAELALYSTPGELQPWLEHVRHSQGTTQGSRAELLAGEIERIKRYQDSRELITEQQVWEYLEMRDSG